MDKNLALKITLLISIAGMSFSGYLSYGEVILQVCPTGGCGLLFGVPACLYGFVMYALVFATSLLGIIAKK